MPGLERTEKLLEFFKNPHLEFPSIHVAGTNGKGSVCATIASIIKEAGYKVGLYTSPHIFKFNERIQINGEFISDDEIIELASSLMSEGSRYDATFFEITTAMAFKYFSDKKVDIAIIETGMGGRFDSTNIVNPILQIITNIGYDHQEWLGNTIEEIALDKAGIIKNKIPVITSENNPVVLDIFSHISKSQNAELINANGHFEINSIRYNDNLTMLVEITNKQNKTYMIYSTLSGMHQISNIKAILSACELLNNKYKTSDKNIIDGFKNLKSNFFFRGRIDLLKSEPDIIMDVSHNADSINSLVKTLLESGYKEYSQNIIFGAMSDKNINEMLGNLRPIAKRLIITQPQIERAAPVEAINAIAEILEFKNIVVYKKVRDAVAYSTSLNETLLIAGSFYLCGEALNSMNIELN